MQPCASDADFSPAFQERAAFQDNRPGTLHGDHGQQFIYDNSEIFIRLFYVIARYLIHSFRSMSPSIRIMIDVL